MEDPFTTITINIPETPAGDRIKRIREFVEGIPGLIIRPVRLTNRAAKWQGGIVIQPETCDSWIAMIEPYRNRVILKNSGEIPFDDKSEVSILSQILKYYYDQLA